VIHTPKIGKPFTGEYKEQFENKTTKRNLHPSNKGEFKRVKWFDFYEKWSEERNRKIHQTIKKMVNGFVGDENGQ